MADELDIEQPGQLLAYLRRTRRLGQTPGEVSLTTLTGGVSNRTVLVEPQHDSPFVVKQALARLRVEVEWRSDPSRIHREALALRSLARLVPSGALPQLLFEDPEHHLLAMTAVPKPHENWKTLLLRGDLQEDHVVQFATLLAGIHERSRSPELAETFADRSFFESLRLEPYYLYAAACVPQAARFLRDLVEQTRRTRLCVVHGDYSPKNILVYRDQLVLLDHEVIHFGDPTFDIGFGLTHLLSKAHHMPESRERFLAAAHNYWTIYRLHAPSLTAQPDFEQRAVQQTLGCLLARVEGRSPLEYLTPAQRERQRQGAVRLMGAPPRTVPALIEACAEREWHDPFVREKGQ